MESIFDRTELLISKNSLDKLKNCHILLFGLGGVGGYTLEALIRMGIQNIDIVDGDSISQSNLNRQILATIETIGASKVDVAIKRAKSINPETNITGYNIFYLTDNKEINFLKYDFVIDAIDTVTAKIEIIKNCKKNNIPIISCMGTGNKLDATKLIITDIYKTSNCKLAKIIRKLCKENNIKDLPVVSSTEVAKKVSIESNGKHSPASISYVPAVAGMLLAQYVILNIIKE